MLNKILDIFYNKTGICFTEKQDIVFQKIENFSRNRNFSSFHTFLQEIEKGGELWQDLVNFLTVNETYFFREYRQLELLVEFAAQKNRFSILCLPCSSGEEVYTIAIMLEKLGLYGRIDKLIGIDINSVVVEKAISGSYGKKSFHKTSEDIKNRFFTEKDGHLEVKKEIKSKCQFYSDNIFDEKIFKYGKFDFVLSRNMLIYFDKNSRERASSIFFDVLKDDGKLFLGHADILGGHSNLKKKLVNSVIYYER